jgi:hypothetical protein
MANTQTEIKIIEFVLDDEHTHCNVFYSSNEPGTPWGGGWKNKSYPSTKTIKDIIDSGDIPGFLLWDNGFKRREYKLTEGKKLC